MKQNKDKMCIGIFEVLYFGFFIWEPKIFPDALPPSTCSMPFTQITTVYTCLILFGMFPVRIWFNTRINEDHDRNSKIFGVITLWHMVVCFSFFIYAICAQADREDECWDPFTMQYLNYYLQILLVIGNAATFAMAIVLLIVCMPCIAKQLYEVLTDERERAQVAERVVVGLAKRQWNPE